MNGPPTIKLSSPATREFWEIPVLLEDEHLLALDKPGGLLSSPDPHDPDRPNLLKLLHAGIAEGKPWARERALRFLMETHRLDFEASGVLLLARNKPALAALANAFGSEIPRNQYLVLVRGAPAEDGFEVEAKLAPHPVRAGLVRVDPQRGKRACTRFEVLEKFAGWTLMQAVPLPDRPHQVRVHLQYLGLPVAGDSLYGGKPLLLSQLKRGYHLKLNQRERPLVGRAALHAQRLRFPHPVTGELLDLQAPWPKDLVVAVKYLRRYAPRS